LADLKCVLTMRPDKIVDEGDVRKGDSGITPGFGAEAIVQGDAYGILDNDAEHKYSDSYDSKNCSTSDS